MVASLQPTNDYKTSVLSGLSPGIILQICERAMSFWEYQSRQESAFQQAVLKSVNDKSAQCQKQLDSVIREANSELALRKNREQQDQLRDKDKEYGRLKGQYDQLKRKVLLAPSTITSAVAADNAAQLDDSTRQDDIGRSRHDAIGLAGFSTLTVNDVVNGMEAGGIQRTPLRGVSTGTLAWQGQPPLNSNGIRGQVAPQKTQRFQTAQVSGLSRGQIEGFGPFKGRRGNSDGNATDSPNEVEAASGLGLGGAHIYRSNSVSAIGSGLSRDQIATRQTQRGFGFGQGMARSEPLPYPIIIRSID
ncbi:hypothetical protein FS842_009615 [Serendipita sp. 407]|nr:hypothetical protein FS842_009615 [Serendipita sp. 407]